MKRLLGKTAGLVIPVAIIAGVLGIAVCSPKGKVMNTVNQSGSGGQKQTKVELESGEIVITSQDVEEIRRALDDYLKNSRQEIAKSVPENLLHQVPDKASQAWIDEDGVVRIDSWVLQASGDDLVLSYRIVPPTTKFGYGFRAGLERLNQQWKVTSVSFEKYYPRRS
ncbi:MAG TPA: hypothetical protein VFV58_25630 [Blastocatellia bacterium]|jgi:hypothetical protein|nr:hypothetical protein [Blastocatellia bacterium]